MKTDFYKERRKTAYFKAVETTRILNQEVILKRYISPLLLLLTGLIISGCKSTENYDLVKYDSRCADHAKTVEENINKPMNSGLISTRPPNYPAEAARKGIEGYVKLEYDIDVNGKPINISVTESYPSTIFERAAIYSLKGWQYEPIASKCNTTRLDFTLG